MSEVEVVCIVFCVLIFLICCMVFSGAVIISENMRESRNKQSNQGRFIEFTLIMGEDEEKSVVRLSEILEVHERVNGGAQIVIKQYGLRGRVDYGCPTKESYEEIMQRIRVAGSEDLPMKISTRSN